MVTCTGFRCDQPATMKVYPSGDPDNSRPVCTGCTPPPDAKGLEVRRLSS